MLSVDLSTLGLQSDDDSIAGMGFSIFITVCSLLGLLFCFRRASMLLPRNLNIQLQRFNQDSDSNGIGRRGPIALSEDDILGATGLEWEDIETQLNEDDEERDQEEEMDDMASRPLKPMSSQDRYVDDDDEEGEEMSSNVNINNRRYRDNDDNDDNDDAVEGEGEINENPEVTSGKGAAQKDSLFQLEDGDSD
ncbi:hypothetical protein BGZ49_000849 [Haplosporangium sp. Z 27]|nr:hypothetical protein BGZ49_000849 [Haplosporangium sp. Z 27]